MYQAPYGTGNWAVAAGVTRASACANGVCTFTDTQAALSSFSVSASPPSYFPALPLWAGGLVLGPSVAGGSWPANASAYLEFNDLNSGGLWQTNTTGSLGDTVDSARCYLLPGSPIWQACTGQDQDLAATLLHTKSNQDGGLNTGLKGAPEFHDLGLGSKPHHHRGGLKHQ
jgi:hypothetical protein